MSAWPIRTRGRTGIAAEPSRAQLSSTDAPRRSVASRTAVGAGAALALAAVLAALALAGCVATTTAPGTPGTPIHVVAAENFWGSIAEQLGGDKVQVTSVISNPNTDPHDYEPTVADARNMTTAQLVVYNGVGYDPWVQKLLGASPNAERLQLGAGDVAGVAAGGNPHLWYSPSVVREVVRKIAEDYKRLDPADAAYFDQRQREFETESLAAYDGLVSQIASDFAGTPVGASESIVSPLADALHLKLLTPSTFLTAISEGVDPSAADKATVDQQIKTRQIKVFIYNQQNSTPDVLQLVAEAKAAGIPVVTVTETLEPVGAMFQDWQASQLKDLDAALRRATGR
jgi:zinc/manganese transport system substrate-binding protein